MTVLADEEPLQAILEEIAAQNGLELIQHRRLDRQVSLDVQERPLIEVLNELLGTGDSYQLIVPGEDLGGNAEPLRPTLWIFAAGEGAAYAAEFHETVLMRGRTGDRKASIRALRDLGTPGAIQALALALGDDDDRVRAAAMAALSDIGTDDALAALASSINGGDWNDRAAATGAMAMAGGRSAESYLDIALGDHDPRVRAAATHALGDLDDEAARARLKSALSDPDPDVREHALDVLEGLDDQAMFHAVFPPQ